MAASNARALATEILSLTDSLPSDGKVEEQASKALIDKSKQLITTLQKPMEHASSLMSSMAEPAVIRTLMQFGVLEAMPAPPASTTAGELADKTGAQSSLLARLLRVLVGTGFIRQVLNEKGSIAFAHTDASQAFSTDFLVKVFGALYDKLMVMISLPEYFKSHPAKEPDGEESKKSNPQTWKLGCEGQMTAFEVIAKYPEHEKNMQIVMSMAEVWRPWTGFYDFGRLADGAGERPVFVDVGGGDGGMIARLLEAHPEIKPEQCILQDREAIVNLAKERQQRGTLPAAVQCQAHDFFKPQPVKGAKAYHLRAITHDWSDSVVVEILSNIVPAMSPDSKVIIGDNIFPEQGTEALAGVMDLMMLCIGGKERTKKDFENVLDRAGLRIEGVHHAGRNGEHSGWSIIEAVLK